MQQPERFLSLRTGSKKAIAKWSPWRAQLLIWKPLYNILESSDLNAMVVNARHMKAVPDRKTDVKDTEWIADLLQHGLLQASYIHAKDQRELRELVRYRKSLVGECGRKLNPLPKMLEGANIKLSGTVRDINGKSTATS